MYALINLLASHHQQLRSLAILSLKNMCFQKNLWGEFPEISRQPVKVETESRIFSVQHVYKLAQHDN